MAARGTGNRRRRPGTPPRHRARPRPRPGSPGTADGPRRRLTEQVAPALCTLRNARRGSTPRSRRSVGLGGARAQRRRWRRRLRSFCPRFCRRRGPAPRSAAFAAAAPAPAPARTSAASLSGARAAHAQDRPGLVSPGNRSRRRAQHQLRAVLAATRPRAPGAALLAAPHPGPGPGRRVLAAPPRPAGPSPSRTACSPLGAAPPPTAQPCEARAYSAAELGRVGKLRAGRGRGPTPPAAPPRHVLPLFPPRLRQLRAAGPPSAASSPWPPEKPSTEARTPSSLLPFNLLVPGEGS